MMVTTILGVANAATLDNDSPDVLRQGYSSAYVFLPRKVE